MTTIMKKITKGIVLNGESSDLADNLEGTLFHNSSTARIKSYIQGAVREVLTNSQSQVLTNKTIDADSNTISNIELDNLKSGVLSTSISNSSTDTEIPSAKAVYTALGAQNQASEISFTPIISVSGPQVQDAIGQVQSNLESHTGASTNVHGLGVGSSVVGTTDNQILTTKTIDADNNTISNLEVINLKSGVLNTSTTLTSASDIQIPSALAVKTYVDNNSGGGGGYQVSINDNQAIATPILMLDPTTLSADVSLTAQRLSTVSTSSLLAIDGTIPNYPLWNSTFGVNDCIVQPDGKIILGGSFTRIGVTAQRRLCRYNANYTLDTEFNSNVQYTSSSGEVKKIILQPDGKILVVGTFLGWNGVSGNNYLVRLNNDGTRDATFCNAIQFEVLDTGVFDIALDSLGNIYCAGNFSNYKIATFGAGISYLVKFNSAGAVDVTWANNAVRTGTTAKFNNPINVVTINSSDECFVGGDFTNYTLSGRSRFVKLQNSGTIDTGFTDAASLIAGAAAFSSSVRAITLSGTDVFVGGSFVNYKISIYGNGISYLVKLNSSGAPYITFVDNGVRTVGVANFNAAVYKIKVVSSDIYVAGAFIRYPFSAGITTNPNGIVKLAITGIPDTTWNNNQISKMPSTVLISGIDVDLSGNILIGGLFNGFNSTSLNNGSLCHTLLYTSTGTQASYIPYTSNKFTNITANPKVSDTAIQSDGKRILVGSFYAYGGVANRNLIIRLNADNSVDTGFCFYTDSKFNVAGNEISRVILQPDGKILLAGLFTSYAGITGQDYLIRLNSDGSADTSFNTAVISKFNSVIYDIALSGTSILAGGSFTNFGGITGKNYLIRLTTLGAEDTAFTTAAVWTSPTTAKFSATVRCILVQSSGNILVGGFFTAYATVVGRQHLVGLTSTGALNTAFNTAAVDSSKFSSVVYTLTQLTDGSIIATGAFSNYAAGGANCIARMSSVGVINTTFNTAIGTKFTGVAGFGVEEGLSGRLYIARMGAVYNAITNFDVCILNADGTYNSAIVIGITINLAVVAPLRISKNKSKMEICGAFAVSTSGLNSFYQIVDFTRQAYKTRFQIFKTTLDTYTTSTPETLLDSLVGLVIAVNSSGEITYTTTDLNTDTNEISMTVNEYKF